MTEVEGTSGPSRDVPIDAAHAALLFVDVQNYNARPDGGEYAALTKAECQARYGWFFRTIQETDRKSTRLNSSHYSRSRMPSSA